MILLISLALSDHNPTVHDVCRSVRTTRRVVELEVVVDNDVRQESLEFVRREKPTRTIQEGKTGQGYTCHRLCGAARTRRACRDQRRAICSRYA